ncbi:MAG: ATP-binding protein [Bacteroidetes bacterium]|nr:ATP-binding protein [Bacteroidota bacterium]
MRKYPIGIQDFNKLIKEDYLYVDKTEDIFRLVNYGQYYFLSRPRRFGKSLLVSTLKYLFLGEKDLFKGLWIEGKYEFEPHPVLHVSFSSLGYKDIGLEAGLHQFINNKALEADITLTQQGIGPRFQELLKKLSADSQKVVLLIDEYDKPLVDYIDQPEQAEKNRDILKNFFSIIKDSDPFLRFFLITGVSKFSKVSLFSDLNHLRDITLVEQFETIAGYTQAELEDVFAPDIEKLAQKTGEKVETLIPKIKLWYNGYSWGTDTRLYNPFSILNLFASQRFANYWWETGTPTFLIKLLRKDFHYNLSQLVAGQVMFESFTINDLNWLALLFQTGYLTIRSYDPETGLYTLDYPNREVRDTMHQHLLAAFRETTKTDSLPLLINIKFALEKGDVEDLIDQVNILFSTIPHQLFKQKEEAFFHAVLHLSFSAIGLLVQSEVSTAKGRVDTVVHTKDQIYVMEFKLDASSESALTQIREKRYGSPFLNQGKEVIALGVSFSSETKEVAEWRAVPYETLLVEG